MPETYASEQIVQELVAGTRSIISLTGMAKKHPATCTVSRLRHIFLHRETNGFARAFLKHGNLVFVDEAFYWEAFLANRGKPLHGNAREKILEAATARADARAKARKRKAMTKANSATV